MLLVPGETLGPYKVLSLVGAGGMGEVYRATDTRLGRTVAIKVVRDDVGERFNREIRAIANLKHPHICMVHDIGRHDSSDFLVMEYLGGETLAQRLRRGPVVIADALRYSIQIADALDCAHRAGIIHRDVKPANIMLTEDGAKLLDFGLAYRFDGGLRSDSHNAEASTGTIRLTSEGSIVGTLNYMAPEQLQGKDADARTDIFAFGAVLYEMISGQPAFEGDSSAHVISSIMTAEPPPPDVESPAAGLINNVVRLCLAKNPEHRWRAVFDVGQCLRWAASGYALPVAETKPPRNPSKLMVAGLVIAAAILALYALAPFRTELSPYEFSVIAPTEVRLSSDREGGLALSPDGNTLAFIGDRGGSWGLWVRPLGSPQARLLAGTEGASFPFWSADGRKIGFFANRKLMTISTAGGPPTAVCDAPSGRGGSWGKNGLIIFTPGLNGRIHKVHQDGGTPTPITVIDGNRGEDAHYWPEFLADDTHFIYFARSRDSTKSGIAVASVRSETNAGRAGPIVNTNSRAFYVMVPGDRLRTRTYLLFIREGILMAQAFDQSALSVLGEPQPLAERVAFSGSFGLGFFAVRGNTLAYLPSQYEDQQLAWVDTRGYASSTVGGPGHFRNPRLSPDETRVAVERVDATTGVPDIWILDLTRHSSTRFAFDKRSDGSPVWSVNGESIVFQSDRHGPSSLYRKRANGVGDDERLTQATYIQIPSDETADGTVLYSEFHPQTGNDIWMLRRGADKGPIALIRSPFNDMQPKVSPDGKFIAYASDESNRLEIYVQPFPGLTSRWQVSSTGGQQPTWQQDGKRLFYVSPANELMSVDLTSATSALQVGNPQRLFTNGSLQSTGVGYGYDVSHDGKRFLVAVPVDTESRDSVSVVLNWWLKLAR
jgi:serine/threonine protein kinase/Tol biopolymer transport system component